MCDTEMAGREDWGVNKTRHKVSQEQTDRQTERRTFNVTIEHLHGDYSDKKLLVDTGATLNVVHRELCTLITPFNLSMNTL